MHCKSNGLVILSRLASSSTTRPLSSFRMSMIVCIKRDDNSSASENKENNDYQHWFIVNHPKLLSASPHFPAFFSKHSSQFSNRICQCHGWTLKCVFNKFKQIVFLICKRKPFISHFHECKAMNLARKLNTHVVDLAPKMIELHFLSSWRARARRRERERDRDGPTQMRGNKK